MYAYNSNLCRAAAECSGGPELLLDRSCQPGNSLARNAFSNSEVLLEGRVQCNTFYITRVVPVPRKSPHLATLHAPGGSGALGSISRLTLLLTAKIGIRPQDCIGVVQIFVQLSPAIGKDFQHRRAPDVHCSTTVSTDRLSSESDRSHLVLTRMFGSCELKLRTASQL